MIEGTVIDFAARRNAVQMKQPAKPSKRADQPKRLQFRDASIFLEYWKSLRHTQAYARLLSDRGIDVGVDAVDLKSFIARDFELLDKVREAQAALLLAPATTVAQLNEKRRLMKRGLNYIPVNKKKLATAIEADEAFLAIPRGHRHRALAGKEVRS